MRSSFKYSVFMCCMTLWLMACNDEFMLVERDQNEKLVVQAQVVDGENIRLHVGRSLGIHDDTSKLQVTDAKALFFVNGTYKESSIPDEQGWCTSTLVARSGDQIRLEVQSVGFEDAYSADEVPVLPVLSNLDFSWGMDNSGNLRFTLEDREGAEYYSLRIQGVFREFVLDPANQLIRDSIFSLRTLPCESKGRLFFSDRNFISTGTAEEYFTDEIFKNQNLELDLRISPLHLRNVNPLKKLVAIEVTCSSLNAAQYALLTSLSLSDPVHGGNFRAGSYTSGNIVNGFGIMACSAQAKIRVNLP
jgi:hypothetical protein